MKKALIFVLTWVVTLLIFLVVLLVKKQRCISLRVNRKKKH